MTSQDSRTPRLLLQWIQVVLRITAIGALIATVWSVLLLAPWDQAQASEQSSSPSVPFTQVHPIGVNTFLSREVEDWKRERTIEMAAELGAGWIKDHFAWQEIEPQDDVYWDSKYQQSTWEKYDRIVQLAEQHGLRIIARIDQTPAWARPAGTTASHPPTDLAAFSDFIEEFVRHFKGHIQFLQIWNEPNLAAEWGGEIDPEGYAALLRVAAESARRVDPNVVILSAPLAQTVELSQRAMNELTYWQALYDAGAAPYFDIIGANAYGLDQPPAAPPGVDVLNMRRVELLAELSARNGDGDKPIWINEYGWNASPASFPPEALTWSRVDEETQAAWTAEGIDWAIEHWDRLGVINIWYLRHVGDIPPTRSEYYFRLVDPEFTPRLAYWKVQELAESLTIASPRTYSDLAAPIRPIGAWPITRRSDASNGEFITGQAGAQLTVTFEGTDLELVLSPDQPGATISVQLIDPENDDAPASGDEIHVHPGQSIANVVQGPSSQDPGVRTALVTVESGELRVDGIRVQEDLDYTLTAGFAGVMIFSAAGWWFVRRMRGR